MQGEKMFSNKTLVRIVVPLIFEQLLMVFMGMADTYMVSGVGEAAISGISNVDQINILMIQLFSALCTGGAVVAAQYIGKGERATASSVARQLLHLSVIVALIFTAFSVVFNRGILDVLYGGVEKDVMDYSVTYFFITALSFPFLALYNSGAAVFRATGNSRVSMTVSIVSNVVNIIGNAVLIYAFDMGVTGAALATLFSRIVAAVIMLILIRRPDGQIVVKHLLLVRFEGDKVRKILTIAIPNALESGMFQGGKLIVQGLIASLGTAANAANAACNIAGNLTNVPGNAVCLAMTSVVGQCVGADRYDEAVKNIKKLSAATYIMLLFFNAVVFIFAEPISGLFHLEREAIDISVEVLRQYTVAASIFWVPSFLVPYATRAAGDARFTMICSIFSMFVFRVGFSYILTSVIELGVLGIWIAMEIDWVVRSICYIARFYQGGWKKKKLV